MRILIVEDDALQAQVLDYTLTVAGFEVDIVDSGLDAVWKVREGDYDAVLVDYRLPEIDGLATAKLVVDLMGQAARPVLIALTATPEQLNERESGTQSAFDVVLNKSCDVRPLLAAIRRLASAPDRAAKQAARSALLLQAWMDYEVAPPRPGAQGDDPGPVRILIVDDDVLQQQLLTTLLEARGYRIDATADGLEAVRRLREGCYDLALIDYNMPEIDGLAAGKLVRDLLREAVRPRMIALTATPARLRDKEMATLSVFDEIIEKSSDFNALLTSVDRHLKSAPNPATRRAAASAPRPETAA
jgi:CheY-like chemotaxis protein